MAFYREIEAVKEGNSLVKVVPFCAYEVSAKLTASRWIDWRPRRDLNPCYRGERRRNP